MSKLVVKYFVSFLKFLAAGLLGACISFLYSDYLQVNQTYFNLIQSIDKLRFGIERTSDLCKWVNQSHYSSYAISQLVEINRLRDDALTQVVQLTKVLHMQRIITDKSYGQIKEITKLADNLSKSNIKVCRSKEIPGEKELAEMQDKIINVTNQDRPAFFRWVLNSM